MENTENLLTRFLATETMPYYYKLGEYFRFIVMLGGYRDKNSREDCAYILLQPLGEKAMVKWNFSLPVEWASSLQTSIVQSPP